MKLDPDCIRDVLIYLEDTLTVTDDYDYDEILIDDIVDASELSQYDKKQIAYVIYKLSEANYIIAGELHHAAHQTYYSVQTITFNGHEFLNKIRSEKTWTKTKKICSIIENTALSAISAVSEGITTAMINSYFQTNS